MLTHRNFTRVAHARSYAGRRLRNPFFSHEERHLNPWLVLAGSCALGLGLLAAFFYLPFLQYNQVTVNGLTTLSADDVSTTVNGIIDHHRWLIVPGRQLFLMNSQRLTKELDAKYNLASLNLHRHGRTLVIDATERITQVTWLSSSKMYLLDLSGAVVSEASPEVMANVSARQTGSDAPPAAAGIQPTMPIIVDAQAAAVELGQSILDVTRLTNLMILDDSLRSRGLTPLYYTFDDRSQPWVTVTTKQVTLLVDVSQNVTQAIGMFDSYQKQSPSFTTLAYIDLRFGNHLYIKNK